MLRRFIAVTLLSILSSLPTPAAQRPWPQDNAETDALVLKAVLRSQCLTENGYVLLSSMAISPRQQDDLGSADESGAVDDLKQRNSPAARLPAGIACKGVHVLDDRKIRQLFEQGPSSTGKASLDDAWKQFYASFPGATGWMELSLPGYGTGGDIATVYMSLHCGSLCGQGSYVYLHRVDGQWKVLVRFPIWTS
jgi:hypothetical protein